MNEPSQPPHMHGGHPPQPPYGGLSGAPAPYGAAPPHAPHSGARGKNRLGLWIGLGVLLLAIVTAAILYFAGVFDSGRHSSRRGPFVPVTAENIAGVWAVTDCSRWTYEFRRDGSYWSHELQSNTATRNGSWRVEGDRVYITREGQYAPADGSSPTYSRDIGYLSADEHEETSSVTGDTLPYIRCPASAIATRTSSSQANTSAPTLAPAPAPTSGPAPLPSTTGGVAALLQQQVAQMQSRLPVRSGPISINTVTAQGTTLQMGATFSQTLNDSAWLFMSNALRQNICSGGAGNAVRAGATIQLNVVDAAGRSYPLTVSSC